MNKKAQLDEFNPVYAGFGLLAGIVAWFITTRVPDTSIIISAASAIGSAVLIYLWLSFTE